MLRKRRTLIFTKLAMFNHLGNLREYVQVIGRISWPNTWNHVQTRSKWISAF